MGNADHYRNNDRRSVTTGSSGYMKEAFKIQRVLTKSIIYNAIILARFDHGLPTGVDDNELLQRDKYYF